MTNDPFDIALRTILEERDLSIRQLAKLTVENAPAPEGEWSQIAMVPDHHSYRTPGLTHTYIAQLIRGDIATSPRACEVIAHALNIAPSYFAEYRLDVARARLDWRAEDRVGRHRRLPLALRTLEESGLR